jgi:hypothetical protein
VALEHDPDRPRAGQRAHRRGGVGGHQVGEVRGALRRRQSQADVYGTVLAHLAGGDEAQRRDRLVKLGVTDRGERAEDVLAVDHAVPSTS